MYYHLCIGTRQYEYYEGGERQVNYEDLNKGLFRMEAAGSSIALALFYQTTLHHIPGDHNLNLRHIQDTCH